MLGAFFTALSGLRVADRKITVKANNIANLQTTGFKKSEVAVSDLRQGGANVSSVFRVESPGALMVTESPIDLAINGAGYFQVRLANGAIGYTRAGNFRIDAQGRLATANGEPLQPQIEVPLGATQLTVGGDGEVSAIVAGQREVLGQIELANFNNPAALSAAGGNLLIESSASGRPIAGRPGTGGLGQLVSGAQEMSNVDGAEEIVGEILASAAFKANIKVIRVADEMTGSLIDRSA